MWSLFTFSILFKYPHSHRLFRDTDSREIVACKFSTAIHGFSPPSDWWSFRKLVAKCLQTDVISTFCSLRYSGMLLTDFCRHPGSGRSFFFLLIDVNGLSQEIIVERFFDSFYGKSLEAISISRWTIDYFGVTHSPCNLVSYQQFY